MEDPAVLRLKKTLFPDRAAAFAEVIARSDAVDEVPVGLEGAERHGELGGVEGDGGDEELRFTARSERNAVGEQSLLVLVENEVEDGEERGSEEDIAVDVAVEVGGVEFFAGFEEFGDDGERGEVGSDG